MVLRGCFVWLLGFRIGVVVGFWVVVVVVSC